MGQTLNRHRYEVELFMRQATDGQILNIIEDEERRIRDHGRDGEIGRVARIMLDAARWEAHRRKLL